MAVKSEKSASLILGGGFVKHHINNANLMRNGSDYTIYVNTGQVGQTERVEENEREREEKSYV